MSNQVRHFVKGISYLTDVPNSFFWQLHVKQASLRSSPSAYAQAKDLTLEGQLVLSPEEAPPAVVTIPAAAVQVAASEVEEASVAAAPQKIEESMIEVC